MAKHVVGALSMRALTLISSLVITLLVTASFIQERFAADWIGHQEDYRAEIKALATTSEEHAIADEFEIRLRQADLPSLQRVDRCVTCHVGIEDPRMKDQPEPIRNHPGTYLAQHDPDRFGCTICHDGQGRATNWKDAFAHEWSTYFEFPMLRQPYIQARCYRCHDQELEETPVYNQGKQLFESSGCLGCHRLVGKGGTEGPALDGLSDAAPAMKHVTAARSASLLARADQNRNIAFLLEAVQFPKAQPTDSRMIDYGFDDAQSEALAVYLKSLEGESVSGRNYIPARAHPPASTPAERGARLFGMYCSGCHGQGGKGGFVNVNASSPTIPALSELNERLMLFEREDAETLVEALVKTGGEAPSPDDLDLPRASVVVATYGSVWTVIRNGNLSGREDPTGPIPLSMPSWKSALDGGEIVSIVAYLLSVGEYEDDEDE